MLKTPRAPAQAGVLPGKVRPLSKAPAFAGALWLLLIFVLSPFPAHAQTFPKLAGEPVVDAANLLDPAQETALNAKLKSLEASTGRQLAVATIPDLEGRDIADYGYQLGRAWGIGKQGTNDGVVLIVAPNERRTRIEVGYGLEPVLTDAYSSVIINTVMIPRFKAGDYPAGIDAGVDAIAQQIQLPPEEAAARAAQAQAQAAAQARQSDGGGIPGAFIMLIFIGMFVVLPLLRSFGGRRHRRGSGIGEVLLWSAINAAVNSSDNDGGWGGGGGGFGGGGGGGFSGGGGSFGGGGASGGW